MSSGQRVATSLLFVLVLGAVAYLLVGNPFGPRATEVGGAGGVGDEAPALAGVDGKERSATAAAADPELASGFETVGQGDVTVRLLSHKERKVLAGQLVRISTARGEKSEKATGEDGRVLFSGLRAAKDWTLFIEGKGFSPVEVKGIAVKARAVTDLGDLLLGERVVLKGRVIDASGKPLPGTAVSAYLGGGIDLSQGMAMAMVSNALTFPTPTDEATTDDKGLFTLASLAPGAAYEVQAKHPGHALSVQAGIVVAPERASAVLTIVLAPAATVRGKVLDEEGHGVPNATVIAIEDMGGRGFSRAGLTIKKDYARTKADGSYVLDTLNRGQSYRFGVSAEGRAPVFDAQGTQVEQDLVRDFTLAKGGSIAGTVTDQATGKPIENARVVAIVGTLGMGPGRGGRGGRNPGGAASGSTPAAPAGDESASTQMTTTGADGTFRLDGLKPGTVALAQVKAPGYADLTASQFTNNVWGEVKAGETLEIAAQLEPGGTVTGKVLAVGAQGPVALAGATVSVLSMASIMSGYGTAVTAEDGTYKIDGVKLGSSFFVTAAASGYVAPLFSPMDASAQTTMPQSGGVVTKDITMTTAGTVEGTVTNSKNMPVSGARVRVRAAPQAGRGGFSPGMIRQFLPGATNSVVLSDAEGRFKIESVTSDEKQIVEAETDEYVPAESDAFTVRAGEVKRVDVVLQGGGTIRGRVIDDRGVPVSGAQLRVGYLDTENESNPNLAGWRADALLEQRVVGSDADGFFEIPRIRPGRTLVKADKEGYVTYYRRDMTVRPDEVQENVVVTLSRGETISGVVKGEDGKPVAGAWVAVTRQENPVRGMGSQGTAAAATTNTDGSVEPNMSDQTDEQGRFTVQRIPPGGSFSVVVWFAQGYRGFGQGDDSAIKRAVPSGTKDVEMVLKKMPEGTPSGFPGMPRPSGSTGGPVAPRPPGVPGMGGTTPTPPAMGG